MKKLRFVPALTALAALALIPGPGRTVGLGLDVSPAKFEFSMPAGTAYNIPVTVHNSAPESTHVQASMVDFDTALDGNYRFERVGDRANSLLKYASIRPREFDLPANTSQQVQLTISLPGSKALSGEYAGIVFFQTRPVRRAGTNVAFSARVASKIYLTIPGTVKLDGQIVKMTEASRGSDPVYRVWFKNTGNAHVYLNGELMVQKDGQVVDRIAMPNSMLVERGDDRLVELTGKALPAGQYQAIATLDYGGKTDTGGAIQFSTR